MSEISNKQPKQLYMLFFAEMWERFSYYGMRALLVLFMVTHFEWSDTDAYHIYGAYGALVYATPFIGGVIADKILGYRKAVMLGAVLMAVGHIVMAGPDFVAHDDPLGKTFFFAALAFLIIGNGFFKPNISSILGSLYEKNDPRRDAGFTIFYMGVNLGAFLAPLVCGYIGETFGWSFGFGLAGIGMLVGLAVFGKGQTSLGERGLPPVDANNQVIAEQKVAGLQRQYWVYLLATAFVPVVMFLIQKHSILEVGLVGFAVLVLGFIGFVAVSAETKVERERLFVVLIMVAFSTMFWAFFEQAGSSITMFTDRNVNKMGLPTTIFQSVNPMFILLFAPVFSALWTGLANKGKDLSAPVKFSLALFQLGLGFIVMVFGASMASEDGMVGLFWLLLGYLLHTTGELCLSPVGLSMVTKLAPAKIISMVLGAWYLSSSLAHQVGGVIAGYTSTSQFNEVAIEYNPATGEKGKGTHVVQFRMFNVKQVDSRKDTAFSDIVSLHVHVVDSEDEVKASYKPENYTIYKSIKPGEKFDLNARIQYLDPVGDATEITMGTKGQGTVNFEGDQLTYQAAAGFSGQDVFTYKMTNKENTSLVDEVKVVVTIDNAGNHIPKVVKQTDEVYLLKSTNFNKTKLKVNALNYVVDLDGDKLELEIVKKPSKEVAPIIKKSSNLNSFVTPTKTLQIYSNVFKLVGFFCFGAAALLLLLAPFIKKWMHGVN